MRWRRLGRIFSSAGQHSWMRTHAAVPFAEHVEGDVYRIYFTSRDASSRSHVGWLELDLTRPDRILRVADQPLLAPGAPGTFDNAGTTLSWIVRHGGQRFVYYIGWSLRKSSPYHMAIGLAVGDARSEAVTRFPEPIVDRNPIDPLFCTAPCVLFRDGEWHMWYVSGRGWPEEDGRVVPSYETQYATSRNGIDWERTGLTVLRREADEFGFSRASVLATPAGYQMWFSVRGRNQPYRLHHAQSHDGLAWARSDCDAGLAPSENDWDSEMITYPHVFDHAGARYMLYCGNGYGQTGFGLAVLQ